MELDVTNPWIDSTRYNCSRVFPVTTVVMNNPSALHGRAAFPLFTQYARPGTKREETYHTVLRTVNYFLRVYCNRPDEGGTENL